MIYAGTSAHENGYDDSSTKDTSIGTSAFNSSKDDNAYVGYMYGTVGASDYATTHANTNDSTIKTTLDNWYVSNIKDTTNEQYVVDAIYYNDRELNSGTGVGTTRSYYKAYNRLNTNKTPTLKCNQVNDRFTKETTVSGVTGNGALTYPIGLITADEVAYAGGTTAFPNSKYYLYTGNTFWTMSPSYFGFPDWAFGFTTFNTIFEGDDDIGGYITGTCAVRPVISISGTALNLGTGTKTDPFKIG